MGISKRSSTYMISEVYMPNLLEKMGEEACMGETYWG
jgi:hypothetical protein